MFVIFEVLCNIRGFGIVLSLGTFGRIMKKNKTSENLLSFVCFVLFLLLVIVVIVVAFCYNTTLFQRFLCEQVNFCTGILVQKPTRVSYMQYCLVFP